MIKRLIKKSIKMLPVKNNRIVFINFDGRGYGDNPKYICNELINRKPNLDIVWLANDTSIETPEGVKKIRIHTLRAYYYLSTAKVWVDNTRIDKGLEKKDSQYYIQTWHGSLALKKIEKAAEELLDVSYVENAKKDSRITDLFLSNSVMQTNEIKNDFWYTGEVMESGSPRNDIIIQKGNNNQFKNRIKSKIGVDANSKIILYAPTFRDYDPLFMACDIVQLQKTIQERYRREYILAVRLHPNVSSYAHEMFSGTDILDLTSYPDIQELLITADVLITDYSSSVFDFAILKKPIIIYAPDVEKYNNSRGLNSVFYSLPFWRAETEDKLYDYIKRIDSYDMGVIDSFLKEYGSYDDGRSSGRVVDRIFDVMGITKHSFEE